MDNYAVLALTMTFADASQEQKKDPATTAVAPPTPSAPEAPPSLGDVALATLVQ